LARLFGTERSCDIALSGRVSNAHQQIQNLAEAVRLIDADPNQGVATAAAALGLSYSSLYRLFRNLVGLSPKRYAGVMRYYRLVWALLADAPAGGLAQLAAMQGYVDQAHASRDFRRYTGIGQAEFRRHLNGIAKLMNTL
jgi:AraC-like DNA-binding protein